MKHRLLFLLIVCSFTQLPAQTGPLLRTSGYYSSRTFNEEEGLSQKFVFSLAQDRNGVLHMGTERGLVSFNGDQFLTRTMTDGLPEDEVSCIFSDSRNVTWIGSFHKGISFASGGLISVLDSSIVERVNSFAEDKNGVTWGACDGRGAFFIPGMNRKPFFPEGGRTISGPVAIDSAGQLVAGSTYGLSIYKVNEKQELTLNYTLTETQGKKVTAVCLTQLYGREVLLAGVENEGVFCYARVNGKYALLLQLRSELGYTDFLISALACDRNNVLWIGSIGEGVRRVPMERNFIPGAVENYSGLPDENIKSLLVDTENNLWIGTFGHGLVQLPCSAFRFYTKQNGLPHPDVYCIAEDRQGTFWLGNANGMTRFRKDGKQPPQFFDASNGFASVAVNALATDTSGKIWIGTSEGIFRLDPLTEKFENVSQRYKLGVHNVNTITINRDGLVFFGTTDGLYIYNDSAGAFQYLTTMDGLMHNNVQHLYTDAQNSTWFSSAGTPPYYLRENEITAFRQIDKLRGYNINGITQDRSGTYWIASDGDGIFAYNGQTFRQYTTNDGLRSGTCIAITTDTAGIVWALHRNGISLKFPGDTVFYTLNGVESARFYNINPFVYRDRRNVLYFCSDNGLIEVLPQERAYLRRTPQLSLARFFVNGNEQNVRDSYSFGPGTYNLAFEFNNILFGVPTRPPFYYRLLGVDSTWQPVNGKNIIIPNLSSGSYVLEVTASPAHRRGVEISIFIDKPFWQKAWFQWTVLLSIPLIVIGLIRVQTITLRRKNKLLQRLVAEKTALLQGEKESVSRINSELERKNKDITDSIHYAERIQLAILPDIRILKEQFPESFIFFLPRDIVSGDFYWFAQKDGLFITAAVDCTGHGIPGAFMSMIGSTLLNKIVFDYNITGAAEILNCLNKEVMSSLHQKNAQSSAHDGMDIALCVFEREKNQLTFAGAGRPLYLVRDGQTQIHKSAKAGIGDVYSPAQAVYQETTIPLECNDMIYLFSDGYADQFSSATGTKYSSARLQTFLATIAHNNANVQQERVRASFFDWKGEEFQFDDVLMIGIKV